MGEVFRARDTKLNRTVALKRMHLNADNGAAKSRILTEAERASRINHPNIATVYDVIEEQDDVLLVMELVEGQTLRHRLYKPISVDEAVQITSHCAEALAAAHKQGVVHCDIKPENVMLTADGSVKLLDFGVARTIATPGGDTWASRTNTSTFSGTPAYMSPEVLNEQKPDARSDIFSLGVVLYEMLAGENPFHTATMIETANRVIHLDPAPLPKLRPDVSEQLGRIVSHAIEKRPDERYASATELARDLRAVISGQPHLVAAPAHRRDRRYRDFVVPAVVALAVFVVAALAWNYARPKTPAPQTRLVAVLPFSVSPIDRSAIAFSDGLVETLSAKLSRISDGQRLQVIPAWEVRSQNVTTAEQAVKSLGVNLVVEGSLRLVEGNVRVTYALVDPRTHRQMHGDSITAVMSNPFAVEDRVVDSVLSSLQVELQPQQREALNAGRPTEPSAYDFYLRGRGYLQDPQKPENLDSAIAVFQQALVREPRYALALAGLGETYWLKFEHEHDPKLVKQAADACTQAVAIADQAADAHLCVGVVDNGTGKYEEAVQQFQQAIRIDPTDDRAYKELGRVYGRLNRLTEAEETFKQAIRIRPSYWGAYNQLGVFYYNQGRIRDAIDAFKKVTQLAPDNFAAFSNLAGMYLAAGDYSAAIEAGKKSNSIRPSAHSAKNLGIAYFYQRRYDDAVAADKQATAFQPNDYGSWINLAEAYRWAGKSSAPAVDAATRAEQLASSALKVNQGDALAFAARAYANALAGRRGVHQDVVRAATLAPNDPNVLFSATLADVEAGDLGDALVRARAALNAGLQVRLLSDHPAFDALKPDPAWKALLDARLASAN